ncbi:hybrid sensor histidine kinase/response regulator [Cypionkella sp.]|uniref:ATP-binding response regulator n=1 Tax=Cypionkella sp. TaxID=2811411 RepID=UPI002ABC5EFC|nr:response regulator [Cypionkella sp.]MDZ4393707.1 response regulator [Cypionkella sp.]
MPLALCLIAAPAFGLFLRIAGGDPNLTANAISASTVIVSVALHLMLLNLFVDETPAKTTLRILISGLGLVLLAALPFAIAESRIGLMPLPAGLSPRETTLAWLAGMIFAGICQASRHLAAQKGQFDRLDLRHPTQLIVCFTLLTLGFAALATGFAWQGGAAENWSVLPRAAVCAAYAVATATYALHAFHAMTASDQRVPWLAIFCMLLPAALVLVLAGEVPDLATLGMGGLGFLLLLVAILALNVISRTALLMFTFSLILMGAVWQGAELIAVPDPANQHVLTSLLIGLLLLAGLIFNARMDMAKLDAIGRAGDPTPEVLHSFQNTSESWLVRLDLETRMVFLPLGGVGAFGDRVSVPFADFFQGAAVSGVMELMRRLQTDALQQGVAPIRLLLDTRRVDAEGAKQQTLTPFAVHILSGQHPVWWLGFTSLGHEADLHERAERFEKLFSQAMLREERLLSIASHELRTPIAILSMMTDELKSGMAWEDVEISFDKTLSRVVAILDDLRAGSGAEGGLASSSSFTQREIAQQLMDVFRPAATANGIEIRIALSQQADMVLRGDQGRVFIGLSKLVHNAIVHSKGTEIALNAFLSVGSHGDVVATWHVADNGVGINECDRIKIFEPFETGGIEVTDRPGLGLYTARKAIKMIGGDLNLHSDGNGTRFVLTHPARSGASITLNDQELSPMSNAKPIFPTRSVLLVEDNKLVGEITSTRLQKLFGNVRWAETGTSGLEMFKVARPDFMLVDQLMPGLTGSELVGEIRKTDKTLPIVGITASTMGSECQELEAAGANLALEKPLSFAQLRGLAIEFFGVPDE